MVQTVWTINKLFLRGHVNIMRYLQAQSRELSVSILSVHDASVYDLPPNLQ